MHVRLATFAVLGALSFTGVAFAEEPAGRTPPTVPKPVPGAHDIVPIGLSRSDKAVSFAYYDVTYNLLVVCNNERCAAMEPATKAGRIDFPLMEQATGQ